SAEASATISTMVSLPVALQIWPGALDDALLYKMLLLNDPLISYGKCSSSRWRLRSRASQHKCSTLRSITSDESGRRSYVSTGLRVHLLISRGQPITPDPLPLGPRPQPRPQAAPSSSHASREYGEMAQSDSPHSVAPCASRDAERSTPRCAAGGGRPSSRPA